MDMFVGMLRRLRKIGENFGGKFTSEGFTRFFSMTMTDLSDQYLGTVEAHLDELRFRKGVLLSAVLGDQNDGKGYVLRRRAGGVVLWMKRVIGRASSAYSFRIHDRDDAGARILGEMQNTGINLVANALAQSSEHVLGFFQMLRTELAFYVGCLNLHARLKEKGEPICLPVPAPMGTRTLRFTGLYDPCLTLNMEDRVVGNSVSADGRSVVVITGANQGGKSVFLRSVGLAQMMMQSGMFVAAESFAAELCTGLFTHYKREEDATMTSGKLDEELTRMSEITDHLAPNAMLLCNESFAATNQREGSEIARQVVYALLDEQVKVLFVTHLYEFARGALETNAIGALFLRAERRPDGSRTFKLVEGEPLETSYGEDVYRLVFGNGE